MKKPANALDLPKLDKPPPPAVLPPHIMVAAKAEDQILPSSAPTLITGWMETSDARGMLDAATGSCVVPATGLYRVDLSLFVYVADPPHTVGDAVSAMLYRNGVAIVSASQHTTGRANAYNVGFSRILLLTKGDTLQPYCVQYTASAQRIAGSTMNNWFSVERLVERL